MYQNLKEKCRARFTKRNEEDIYQSSSQIVNDISNIYRNYWAEEFLKENAADKSFKKLYENLSDYLSTNKL